MKDLEKILLIVFIADKKQGKKLARKDLGSIFYIVKKLTEENVSERNYEVYPDGVYSANINRLIDYMIYLGLIDVDKEKLKLTDNGFNLAEKIYFSHKEDLELKIIEKLVSYRLNTVWNLAYNLANSDAPNVLSGDVLSLIRDLMSLLEEKQISRVLKGVESGA